MRSLCILPTGVLLFVCVLAWCCFVLVCFVCGCRNSDACHAIGGVRTGQWCFVAVVVSIPISVRMKSYWPLAILGSLGSIADYTTGYVAAFPLKQELVAVRKRDQQEAQRTGGYTPQTPRYIDFSKPSGAEAEAVHPEDEVEERLRR